MVGKNNIILVVIAPNGLRNPERGGGYMRFSRIQNHLENYFKIVLVDYRGFTGKAKIAELVFGFLTLIRKLKEIRKDRIDAVLVVNEFLIDMALGYILASILGVKLLIFMNNFPIESNVGFEEIENLNKGLFSSIWYSMRISRISRITLFLGALAYYVMLILLRNATIIPLTPHLIPRFKQLGLKTVHISPGIGCNEPKLENLHRWIDALYVASPLHPQKGLLDVLRVWFKVVEMNPKAKLVIAGRESQLFKLDELKEKIKDRNIKDNIIIITRKNGLPNKIILKLMSQAKVFVYPSRRDMCPLVIGEALSRGTPVVTYDLPGIKFAYGSCEAVIKVPVGDINVMIAKVLEILENPQLAERLRQAAMKWCKANPWSKAACKEAKAYLLALKLSGTQARATWS
jgi:glycosyltransferase involved in cell wall biosynthesis